ncbi:MAG: hypothetical protein J6P20_10240 [Oscillospiraceae bacterium]|nr:hypothetical protein [Oscillospiraceae bacterium]
MKIYIHANTNKEPTEIINVIIDFDVEFADQYNEPMVASIILCDDEDPKLVDCNGVDLDRLLVDGDGQIIDDEYESLIDTIEVTAHSMGLFCLYTDESDFELDGEKSKSRYIDFCVEDKLDSNSVRFVFFIRISNHRDKHKNQARHAKQRLSVYQQSNMSSGSHIQPQLEKITINGQTYPTVRSALNKIMEIFNDLLQAESTP